MNSLNHATLSNDSLPEDRDLITFPAGELVFAEADPSDFAYVIVEGNVSLTKLVDGREIELAVSGPGAIFGEMGLVDQQYRSATATAVTDTILERLDRDTLLERIKTDQSIALPIVQQLISNLRDTSEKFAHNQFLLMEQAADADEGPAHASPASRLYRFFQVEDDLDAFRPDVMVIEERRLPFVARATLYTLLAMVVFAIAWASLAEIDVSVSGRGTLNTASKHIVLQPMETAVIRHLNASAGDKVHAGDVLAVLDRTFAEADLSAASQSLVRLNAREARLVAELNDLEPNRLSSDEAVNSLELDLLLSRRAGYLSELQSINQNIDSLDARVAAQVKDAEALAQRVAISREIAGIHEQISATGDGSRLNYLLATDQLLGMEQQERKLRASLETLQFELVAAKANKVAFEQDHLTRVSEELVQVRSQKDEVGETVKKLTRRTSLVEVTAPADGVVLQTSGLSEGSVVQGAEALFTIVPTGVDMEFDVFVSPADIGVVSLGQQVVLKLDTLPFQKHGEMIGEVTMISEGTVLDESETLTGPKQAYRVKVKIVDDKLRDVPAAFRMLSGLGATAQIRTGKRKVLTYLFYPVMRTFDNSFQEK